MTDAPENRPHVVAIVPAKDRADTVAATVEALLALDQVDEVLVVDDGSTDDTAGSAAAAGADVLRLPNNLGKGGAVLAGVDATPQADVYLLIDADLSSTAAAADLLLGPVLADEADMVIGDLPDAAGRGGGGRIKAMAGAGLRRATGREFLEPLSGQRALRRELIDGLRSAHRFGLEVALTIDAVRAGARVVEVEVPMDHLHTGGSLAGQLHRLGQGYDIVRALAPRLVPARRQVIGLVVAFVVILAGLVWWSGRVEPVARPIERPTGRVVVFAMNPLGFSDLDSDLLPNLNGAIDEGAVAAMSVRTGGRRPSLAEGYVSLGAGYRSRARPSAGVAYPADEPLGTGTAGQVMQSRSGQRPEGDVVVIGAPATVDLNADATNSTKPGALGEALADSGVVGAVVGNADRPGVVPADDEVDRPAALAMMAEDLSVPVGTVTPDDLLESDPTAPFGVRASTARTLDAIDAAARRAEVIFVDPGDLGRADAFRADASLRAQSAARAKALRHTDEILGAVLEWAGDDTTVMIVSVASADRTFRLTPMVVVGPGVEHGYLVSPSTKRAGLVALTDVAPTILDQAGADIPNAMPGRPIGYQAGRVDLDTLRAFDDGTMLRERTYYTLAVWYIFFIAVASALAAITISRRALRPRGVGVARFVMLAAAALPLASFLFRALPGWSHLTPPTSYSLHILITLLVAGLASRARRTPLSSLNWILGATVAVVAVDCATGTWLHVNSWLGYSLHSAGRFYGVPNTTFAVLAASGILLASAWVEFAADRHVALVASALLLAGIVVVDGAPSLGGDVGGIITLIPVFGLLLWVLSGRRLTVRTLLLVGVVTFAALALASVVDLARPPEARTHLGRFVSDLFDNGISELTNTFLRKQGANLRILQVSIWTWVIPIVAAFFLYVLAFERMGRSLLPRGSALRAGVVAVISGSLLGFLANDSGPIVIALFFAYLVPFLALLALHHRWGIPVLLRAGDSATVDDDPRGIGSDGRRDPTGIAVHGVSLGPTT